MEQFNELSDEQAGKLIKAIFMYAEKKIIPEFDDGMVKSFSYADVLTGNVEINVK